MSNNQWAEINITLMWPFQTALLPFFPPSNMLLVHLHAKHHCTNTHGLITHGNTHVLQIPFKQSDKHGGCPHFPPRGRLQVPGSPRGPCRALVRPGAIQAAPNTQPRVHCVSLTALVVFDGRSVVKGGGRRGLLL